MHPYRDPARRDATDAEPEPTPSRRALRIAYWAVLAWAVFRGAIAAYEGRASRDLWLVAAVALAALPALLRAYEPRR